MGKNNSLRMKHLGIIMAPLLILTLAGMISPTNATTQSEGHGVSFSAPNITTAITLDGATGDWSGVAGVSLTLKSLDGGETVDVEARVAYDSSNIYFVYIIHDDYDFTSNHDFNPHLAVMWAIDDAAGPHMGATASSGSPSTGKVDVWHWEVETVPGTEVGGKGTTSDGNDPIGNLDDEWATDPLNRGDDSGDNGLFGNWDHSGDTAKNGSDGRYVFEIKRSLTTTDGNDTQFAAGSTYKLALAYWDPDETPAGWTDSGHMVSSNTYKWIEVTLADPDEVELQAFEEATTGFVLDGDTNDWDDLSGLSLTLKSLDKSRTVDVEVRAVFDASNIVLLFIIHDDYDFTSNHDFNPHLAVMWAIDDAAGSHMGATASSGSPSTGKVDVWHWEVETTPGTEVGGKGTTSDGNDPIGNLDDEWATNPLNRGDDSGDNGLFGNWDHSGDTAKNGSVGRYIFEIKRSLTTTDANDTQFVEGTEAKMALAYWDPDETPAGWTDSGHMVSSDTFNWVHVAIGDVDHDDPDTRPTGFNTILPFVLGLAVVVLFSRKRR